MDALERARELLAEATPGEWTFAPDETLEVGGLAIFGPRFERVALLPPPPDGYPFDAMLIAKGPTLLRLLVARLEAAEAVVERGREMRAAFEAWCDAMPDDAVIPHACVKASLDTRDTLSRYDAARAAEVER